MRAQRNVVIVTALLCLGALGIVARYALEDAFDAPTVSEVATLAQQDVNRPAKQAIAIKVDGVGFPDWRRWGWKPVGGRTDQLEDDGRSMATVRYRKGKDRIAYSIVSGTGDVNSDLGARGVYRTPPEGKVELNVSSADQNVSVVVREPRERCGDGSCTISSGLVTTVKRRINDRIVILTAWPPSEELEREAQDMALRTKPR